MSMRERIKSSLAHASGSVRCHFGTFETARGCLCHLPSYSAPGRYALAAASKMEGSRRTL